jgi:hypothetical protein
MVTCPLKIKPSPRRSLTSPRSSASSASQCYTADSQLSRSLSPLESTLTKNAPLCSDFARVTPLASISDSPKSFRSHSYEKYASKSFRTHSYKIIGLKVPSNHTLTKKEWERGADASVVCWPTFNCRLSTVNLLRFVPLRAMQYTRALASTQGNPPC